MAWHRAMEDYDKATRQGQNPEVAATLALAESFNRIADGLRKLSDSIRGVPEESSSSNGPRRAPSPRVEPRERDTRRVDREPDPMSPTGYRRDRRER